MRRNLPWFLLAASVALNVFFLAGVFYPHYGGQGDDRPRPDMMAWATETFRLDAQQARALEVLRERIAERRRERGGERGAFRAIIIEALRAPDFDRTALAETLEARRGSMGDMILDMTEDLHGFLAGLSPEQKTAFLDRAEAERDFLRQLLFPPRERD